MSLIADQKKLKVLQISTADSGGGASMVAAKLFKGYRQRGVKSTLLVGTKTLDDSDIEVIDNDSHRGRWFCFWQSLITAYDLKFWQIRGIGRSLRLLRDLSQLSRFYRKFNGVEEFDFPGTQVSLERLSSHYDIIHAHNLHGDYFDLRSIRSLSAQMPLVLTLHDAWLFSGHCAFSLGCDRWQTGCGHCPDLSIYPAVNKDSTNQNWNYKKEIFASSNVYLITPSQWLMDLAMSSLLKDAIVDSKVIPNGIDTAVFFPRNGQPIRTKLGIPDDSIVLMVAASGLKENLWKDFKTLRKAVSLLKSNDDLILLAVGDTGENQLLGQTELRFIEFQESQKSMAELYSAADIYIQSSVVEVFPGVLIEARACGTPVVSTAVGGVPESVKSMNWSKLPVGIKGLDRECADGILCEPSNCNDLAHAIQLLIDDPELLETLSRNAALNMKDGFGLGQQIDQTLAWYSDILSKETSSVSRREDDEKLP